MNGVQAQDANTTPAWRDRWVVIGSLTRVRLIDRKSIGTILAIAEYHAPKNLVTSPRLS